MISRGLGMKQICFNLIYFNCNRFPEICGFTYNLLVTGACVKFSMNICNSKYSPVCKDIVGACA